MISDDFIKLDFYFFLVGWSILRRDNVSTAGEELNCYLNKSKYEDSANLQFENH